MFVPSLRESYLIKPLPLSNSAEFRFRVRHACSTRNRASGSRVLPLSFASERLPCDKRVHVISPEKYLSILDSDDGRESVVIRGARFDGFAMNLIFQCDHTVFLVMVNRKPITFFKNDVVAVARVGCNQIVSPVNHFRPTGEAV